MRIDVFNYVHTHTRSSYVYDKFAGTRRPHADSRFFSRVFDHVTPSSSLPAWNRTPGRRSARRTVTGDDVARDARLLCAALGIAHVIGVVSRTKSTAERRPCTGRRSDETLPRRGASGFSVMSSRKLRRGLKPQDRTIYEKKNTCHNVFKHFRLRVLNICIHFRWLRKKNKSDRFQYYNVQTCSLLCNRCTYGITLIQTSTFWYENNLIYKCLN